MGYSSLSNLGDFLVYRPRWLFWPTRNRLVELHRHYRFNRYLGHNVGICPPSLISSKRRSVMTSPKKPQAENLKPAIRKCLMCSQSFQSRDIGERICPDCKDSKTWRQGSWVDKRPRWSDPIPLWFNVLIIQTSSQSWQNFLEFEELENKSINYIV